MNRFVWTEHLLVSAFCFQGSVLVLRERPYIIECIDLTLYHIFVYGIATPAPP